MATANGVIKSAAKLKNAEAKLARAGQTAIESAGEDGMVDEDGPVRLPQPAASSRAGGPAAPASPAAAAPPPALDPNTAFLASLFRSELGAMGDRVSAQFAVVDARFANLESAHAATSSAMSDLAARVSNLEASGAAAVSRPSSSIGEPMEEPTVRLRSAAPAAPPSKWLPDVVVIGGLAPRSEASAIKTEIQNVVARMSLRFRNQVRFMFTTALRDNKGFVKVQEGIDVWAFVEQLRAAHENFNKPVAAGG